MGHGFLRTQQDYPNDTKELAMSPMKRYATKQAKARKRRRLKAQDRLKQQRAQAQHSIEAIHQALKDLDFPETLVAEIEGRLQAQQKLLGKIVGLMFPTLFGCRHGHELTRVRGWNKHVPSRLLGALPTRSWLKRLRRLGLEMLLSMWRHTQDKSPSTHSRWQWRWIVDDAVFRKYGKQLGLVGTRSEEHTSELQSRLHLVCRLLLEKKKKPVCGGAAVENQSPDSDSGTPVCGP